MRNRCLALLALLIVAGCTDATGSASGGQPLIATEAGGPPTWTAIYKDYFGPSGQASCSALTTCHISCTTAAGTLGGFVCTSKEACWLGMTGANQLPTDAGVDGAADAGAPSASGFCNSPGVGPVVSSGLLPTQMPLYLALHQPSSSTDNTLCSDSHKTITYSCNMPCGDPSPPDNSTLGCHQQAATYTFTQDDLSRISTWIQQGAQYN